jgi:L-asparaginase II
MNDQIDTPLVELTRGELVESMHYGSVVISDPMGNILFHYGDPYRLVYLRSSAKPLQTLALLEHDGIEQYGLVPEEIAILCASHSGTDRHVKVLHKLLTKIGIKESDLQCGTRPPLDKKTYLQSRCEGKQPTPIRHECSGKHSGMLALAKMLHAPLDNYLNPNHAAQQLILRTCAEMLDIRVDQLFLGTDGCSAPIFAVPMQKVAQAYARLCDPQGLPAKRATACRQITRAMTQCPYIVAGPHRFDTALIETASGKLIAKVGAEGYFCIGILPDNIHDGSPALGITIKISDGDLKRRAHPVAAMTILKHLGLLTSGEIEKLSGFDARPIKNWRQLNVGEIRASDAFIQALEL